MMHVSPAPPASPVRGSAVYAGESVNVADGRDFLAALPVGCAAAVVFDPQYRGVMDRMAYGNEGVRQGARCALPQMGPALIADCLSGVARVLRPSGHAFVWLDKFELAEGRVAASAAAAGLECVDLVCWDKDRFGMGYRTRRSCEYLLVAQRPPRRARGVWRDRGIRDVWRERSVRGAHPHAKPVLLQARLLASVTFPGDWVVDPCAGGYSVLEAVAAIPGRRFLGCDLLHPGAARHAEIVSIVTASGFLPG